MMYAYKKQKYNKVNYFTIYIYKIVKYSEI